MRRTPFPARKTPMGRGKGVSDRAFAHNALAHDFAEWIDTGGDAMAAVEVTLPSGPRADVVVVRGNFADWHIIDVKVTRADLLRDVNDEKWRAYRPYCHRFSFAGGVDCRASVDDLPTDVGYFQLRSNGMWTEVSRARSRRYNYGPQSFGFHVDDRLYRAFAEALPARSPRTPKGFRSKRAV